MFRTVAILLGLLPVAVLEIGLRLAGEPTTEAVDLSPVAALYDTPPLFRLQPAADLETEASSESAAAISGRGDRWIVDPERYNFFRPDSFLAEKPRGLRRVFVLGGSTVQGRPFATETAFSSWLRLRLEACRPDLSFEVVNCGGVSYASYRLAKVLEEVLGHEPDAIVLYTGHNEFLEDRAYREVRQLGPMGRFANRLGDRLRTVRWLREKMAAPARDVMPEKLPAEVNARLDHAEGWSSYHRNPQWRRSIEADFEATLRRMVEMTRAAHVPLILCMPTCDLAGTPPFKVEAAASLGSETLEVFESLWSSARDPNADSVLRLEKCRRCLQIDPQHAGANYLAGRLLYEPGNGAPFDPAAAKSFFISARDHDVCPLRATSAILEATRRVAQQCDVRLVEFDDHFDKGSPAIFPAPDGIPDPEAFVDHVHPTIGGHQQIAEQLARVFEQLGWIQIDAESEVRYRRNAANHLASLGEEYFHRGYQRLEGLQRWATGRLQSFQP